MKRHRWRHTAVTVCGYILLTASTFDVKADVRIPGTPAYWSGESTDEFHLNCPGLDKPVAERGVLGGFSEQCESRLNQKFLDEIPLLIPFTAQDSTLTWRYVLDDPLGKRNIVLDTLDDTNCMSPNEQAIGNELASRCNAAVIADYAVLKYRCAGGFYWLASRFKDGIDYPWTLNLLERLFDSDSYWQKRWGIENAYFRHAWIAAKCAKVPEKALASLGVFENTMRFGGRPESGEEGWWWVEQGFEAYQLMGVADRLSSNFVRTEYGYESNTLSQWQRIEPVMAELLQIKDPGIYSSEAEVKAARLKHFIAASTWLRMRRANVSESWLHEQIGEYTNEELEQAGAAATEMMTNQEVGTNWR